MHKYRIGENVKVDFRKSSAAILWGCDDVFLCVIEGVAIGRWSNFEYRARVVDEEDRVFNHIPEKLISIPNIGKVVNEAGISGLLPKYREFKKQLLGLKLDEAVEYEGCQCCTTVTITLVEIGRRRHYLVSSVCDHCWDTDYLFSTVHPKKLYKYLKYRNQCMED